MEYEAMEDSEGVWKIYRPSQHGTMTPVTGPLSQEEATQRAKLLNNMASKRRGVDLPPEKYDFMPSSSCESARTSTRRLLAEFVQ